MIIPAKGMQAFHVIVTIGDISPKSSPHDFYGKRHFPEINPAYRNRYRCRHTININTGSKKPNKQSIIAYTMHSVPQSRQHRHVPSNKNLFANAYQADNEDYVGGKDWYILHNEGLYTTQLPD